MERDTDPGVARRHQALIGALSGPRRIELEAILARGARELCEAGVRARHPDAGPSEIRWRIAAACYGEAVARRAFGPPPPARP